MRLQIVRLRAIPPPSVCPACSRNGGGSLSLEEVAHMDTEPRLVNNNLNFNYNIWAGPWGVFPFLDSGTIMASDGLNGLVLMELNL